MKSIVFSFKRPEHHRKFRGRISVSDLRYYIRRYGLTAFFISLLMCGLGFGALYANNADLELFNSLDFLFTTNLDARLSQNAAGTFCACFASDFIFLFTVFLLGFAPWGIPFMLFAVFFKGFGTGLTAGYLFSAYSFKGAGFYLLILLPGTFVFCLALVMLSAVAFDFSKHSFLFIISKNAPVNSLRGLALGYCSRSMSLLLMTFGAGIIDTILWTLFSGAFSTMVG